MDTFQTNDWEHNTVADTTCKELFKRSTKRKQKTKLKKNLPVKDNKIKKRSKITKYKNNLKKKKDNIRLQLKTNEISLLNNETMSAEKKLSKKQTKRLKNLQTNNLNNRNTKGSKTKNNSTVSKEKGVKGIENYTASKKKPKKNKKRTQRVENSSPKMDKQSFTEERTSYKSNIVDKLRKIVTSNTDTGSRSLLIPDKVPQQSTKKTKFVSNLKTISLNERKGTKPVETLRQRMLAKLKSARFRYLNEQIYTNNGKDAQKLFRSDPEAFKAYHEGYRQQVNRWPLNPLDIIIKSVKKMPKSHVIADFGCGEAKLSMSVEQKVNSFDLVAVNEAVTACDMANVPLETNTVDVAVFCLSLMGTNLRDYLLEANRVLKNGGLLKIAEVESRFDNADTFIEGVQRFGFKICWKDLSHKLFYLIDFKKESDVKNKKKLPTITLHPCLYKKR